jgi:hypothetical protein
LKVQTAIEKITQTLTTWPEVAGITLMEHQSDIYDPYFFISLDVYYSGTLRSENTRRDHFAYTGGFEAGALGRKDRFMLEDIPFRIEYKNTSRFEEIPKMIADSSIFLREGGTYYFHRFLNSEIRYEKDQWVSRTRPGFLELPEDFWVSLRTTNQNRMEYYLSDLGAAVMREDNFFFTISAAGFLKSLCSTLYAINRQFEPSSRYVSEEVFQLSKLPDTFVGSMDNFLNSNEASMGRKREVAEILTKKILHL